MDVEIKIMLPDRSITTFTINRLFTADRVYETIIEKISLPKECKPYFYLFEIFDNNFGKIFFKKKFFLNIL